MLKLIGSVLILFAGTMLGFYQALQLARRPRQIRQLIGALQRLETEIHYGGTPLPDALRSAAKSLSPALAAMLEEAAALLSQSGSTTPESWREALLRHWGRTSLKSAEQEALLQLGATLGASSRDDQIRHIRLAAAHLQEEEAAARDDQKRYETMWKSLGVLGGALVVILMY